GVTTFNLPDLRGRAPIGAGQGAGLTNRELGQEFGDETHVISTDQMPRHHHEIKDPGHQHKGSGFINFTTPFGQGPLVANIGEYTNKNTHEASLVSQETTGISIQDAGKDAALSLMQPWAA